MANCRLQNLTPTCGYNGDGVVSVMLLDFEDFIGFTFEGNASYASCYVDSIVHGGAFVTIDLPDFPAQYNSSLSAGIYGHSLEAFIAELSAPIISDLHLATKRPQLVVFKTRSGRYFTFGHDSGAKASYTVQTADNAGAVLTLSASSQYPLFEVSPQAFEGDVHPFMYVPLFDDTAVCDFNNVTDVFTGFLQATLALRVSAIDGQPLDANNRPTAVTGLRQAALLLEGVPVPPQYAITGTFPRKGDANGEPTITYAPNICEEGVLLEWILDDGTWDNNKFWLDDGIWNY